MEQRSRFVNRGFTTTFIALLVCAEVGLRVLPRISLPLFEFAYGDALAMYLTIEERLRDGSSDVRILALGDSLSMTQFRPDLFAVETGLPEGWVFNASYPNMSFVSQERMLRKIGVDRFEHLDRVLYFVNVQRLARSNQPNTEVLRVGLPDPEGPWKEMVATKRIAPLLDYSRLYGLSYHLVWTSWRQALFKGSSWDRVEYLGPHGGVSWPGRRMDAATPVYPSVRLMEVSPERLAEMRRVLELFRSREVPVTILQNVIHPGVSRFASKEAENAFETALRRVARDTGSLYLPSATAGFTMPRDTDFCDYGHTNISGGEAFTRWLVQHRNEILASTFP